MPRYYCDYCGTYLTHDSAPGRRQHNRGEHPSTLRELALHIGFCYYEYEGHQDRRQASSREDLVPKRGRDSPVPPQHQVFWTRRMSRSGVFHRPSRLGMFAMLAILKTADSTLSGSHLHVFAHRGAFASSLPDPGCSLAADRAQSLQPNPEAHLPELCSA